MINCCNVSSLRASTCERGQVRRRSNGQGQGYSRQEVVRFRDKQNGHQQPWISTIDHVSPKKQCPVIEIFRSVEKYTRENWQWRFSIRCFFCSVETGSVGLCFLSKKKCIKQRTEFIDDLLFPYPAQVNLLRNFITSLVYVIMSQFPSPLQLQKIKNKIKIKNQIKLEHNFGRKTLNATCTFTRVYAVCV